MNFWKKLFGAARSAPQDDAPDPGDGGTDAPAAQNFTAFIELLSDSLAPDAAQRIRDGARAAWQANAAEAAAEGSYAGADAYVVLQEVMAGEQGQRAGQWLILHVDWRASDEIGWQVEEILARTKVQSAWDGADAGFDSVPGAFAALAQWLAIRGLALLHIETDADEYCAVIVDAALAHAARQYAEGAGLTVYDHAEFAARN